MTLRDDILDAGLLVPASVDGVYGRSDRYERVAAGVMAVLGRLGADDVEDHVHFPPVLPRVAFERTGYIASFPNLMGSVHSFFGDDARHAEMVKAAKAGERWSDALEPTDVMLCSAACHSLYPGMAGTLPAGGRTVQVSSWCFRHEPSRDLMRMQAFRMVEYVFVGEPSEAVACRDEWLGRGRRVLEDLGLDVDTVTANDPFFGRRGRLLAQNQQEAELKLELVTSVDAGATPVAVASSNLHREHFGQAFGITTASGAMAHSTCFGWGLDRVVLALFHTHGTDPAEWPGGVRTRLWS